MKYAYLTVLLLGMALLSTFLLPEPLPAEPILYAVTQNRHSGETAYWALNADGKAIARPAFTPAPAQIHTFRCFDSDIENRRVINRRNDELSEADRAFLALHPIADRLLDCAAREEHEIMSARVFLLEDSVYLQLDFNVNLWWPHRLYRYDPQADSLTELYCFDGLEVTGLCPIAQHTR